MCKISSDQRSKFKTIHSDQGSQTNKGSPWIFQSMVRLLSIVWRVPSECITMTSWWAWWRLISSASRLFTQLFIQGAYQRNTKAPRHCPLWVCTFFPTKHTTVLHYNDAIMSTIASQITSLTIVYSTVYSGADQRKHQSSASLAFMRGSHREPVNSPHKGPVTRKMFPFDDVIMKWIFPPFEYEWDQLMYVSAWSWMLFTFSEIKWHLRNVLPEVGIKGRDK